MTFERIYDESLAQASYIIANDQGDAIVIDPKRDIDTYLNYASDHQLNIKYVAETHIHADYLSGAQELAHATGAELLLSAEGGEEWSYQFLHQGLKNGQVIDLGHIQLEVMHTPGHTPESITFIVKDANSKDTPWKAITGDFIFVGDVGRPDLLEKAAGQIGSQEVGAKQLFQSLNAFKKLPNSIEIWPGHGAGSFCGKSLSNIPQSTLQQEILTNPAFHHLNNEAAFVKYILDGQPEPPKYFAVMKQWNQQIRPLKTMVSKVPALTIEELQHAVQQNIVVIDTRSRHEVAKGFIPNSYHIELSKTFSTFVGSLIDVQQQVVLIANENQVEEINRMLMRIGMDNIYGYISDISLYPNLQQSQIIDSKQVIEFSKNRDFQLIDVRTVAEYESGHIENFQNSPLAQLEKLAENLDPQRPTIVHCQSGVRSAMAYSVLKRLGFENLYNYSGSINDWKNKGLPLVK